jgi:hypothetical protein
VLLDVEQVRAGERLNRVERVQERPAADEERAGRTKLLVQPGEERDAATRRLGVERGPVLRNLRAEEARQPLSDRGRLGVVADEQRRDEAPPDPQLCDAGSPPTPRLSSTLMMS